jgi:hypothetical protein
MVQEVEFLLCKHKALSSNPSPSPLQKKKILITGDNSKGLNRHFSIADKQMANKPMERCSTPNHHENANQNHIRYYFTPARMVIANMTDSNKC